MLSRLTQAAHPATALVSMYLKPGPNMIANGRSLLKRELSTASNIKRRQTRQDVMKSLKMLQSKLDTCSHNTFTCVNGLACFAGLPLDSKTHV